MVVFAFPVSAVQRIGLIGLICPMLSVSAVPVPGSRRASTAVAASAWRNSLSAPAASALRDRPGTVWLRRAGENPADLSAWRTTRGRLRLRLQSGTHAATAGALASAHGLRWRTLPGLRDGWRVCEVEPSRVLAVLAALRTDPAVAEAELVLGALRKGSAAPNDPFFASEWNLLNTGTNSRTNASAELVLGGLAGMDANVAPVWGTFGGAGYRGGGVRLGIVDDGLESAHPDLLADELTDRDWTPPQLGNTTTADANPELSDDNHGTAVAGIAAARGNNGLGVCGAAPEAQLIGLRLLGGAQNGAGVFLDDADVAECFGYLAQSGVATIHAKNSSWGPVDDKYLLDGPGPLSADALRWATVHGREGLGTIFVFTAGNGRFFGEDANMNGYANAPETICVGAITDDGSVAPYSEPGACVLVCAPGGPEASEIETLTHPRKNGIFTTDRSGADGYNTNPFSVNNGFTRVFNGTSAAAPVVSGVVALMLQANPALGWRDVQEILIRSAKKNRPGDPGWITNGAGLHFHHDFGAGLVDAQAAVTLAQTWTNLPHLKAAEKLSNPLLPIIDPPGPVVGPIVTFTFADSELRVERAVLSVQIQHAKRGQLKIELTSPAGTTSVLKPVIAGDQQANFVNWNFSTVQMWGEQADGVWLLNVRDTITGTAGSLIRADLRLFGTSPVKDEYETWLAQKFTAGVADDPAQVATWGPGADPDRDGLTNLAEGYFGKEPLAASGPVPWHVSTQNGVATLRWRPGALSELEATAQWSPDLIHWYQGDEAPAGVARGFTQQADGQDETATLPMTSLDRAWLRLSIGRLPSLVE